MDPTLVKLAIGGIVLLGCIGLFFGIGLALAASKFKVDTNPLIEEVLEVLPAAQCGGCGYAGCEGYAIAVVNDPDVPPNLCFPGKEHVANLVAELTGKKVTAVEDQIAVVRCSKQQGNVKQKFDYQGFESCSAAKMSFGGPLACAHGCLGFGECRDACPFGAITMVDGFPVVDADTCVGCGKCVKACPNNVIELQSLRARVYVPCSTKDPGKVVRQICEVGCISCKMCVKACPANAVSYEDGLIKIDHKACIAYGDSCEEACVTKCPRNIFKPYAGRNAVHRDTNIQDGLKMAG